MSWGLPVWKDDATFFFVGSSGALVRANCATRELSPLEGRGRSLCAYLRTHDRLLTTERGGVYLLDPTTGRTKERLVTRSTWTPVGDGAVMSPDERFLVYSRKRVFSEIYDCYLRGAGNRSRAAHRSWDQIQFWGVAAAGLTK